MSSLQHSVNTYLAEHAPHALAFWTEEGSGGDAGIDVLSACDALYTLKLIGCMDLVSPGAHGRFLQGGHKRATRRISGPEAWLDAVGHRGHGTAEAHDVARPEMIREALLMGLRLTEGIDRQRFARMTGIDLPAALDAGRLQALIEGGLLELDASSLRATDQGRPVLNALLARLVD